MIKGYNDFRLYAGENPEEKRFVDAWAVKGVLGHLISGADWEPADPTEEQERTAATVVQWLGSPVGQSFLSDLGYRRRV